MIRDEEKRLKRAFRSVLLLTLSAPAAVLYACSSSSSPDNGTGNDASTGGDGTSSGSSGSSGTSGSSSGSSGTSGSSGSSGTSGSSGSSGTSGSSGSSGSSGTSGSSGSSGSSGNTDASVPLCPEGADAAHPQIDATPYLDASDDGACDFFFEFNTCAPFPVVPVGNGCYFNLAQCAAICGFPTTTGCFVTPDNCTKVDGGPNTILDAASLVIDCTKCLGGRRPEAMESYARRGGDEVGAWFAQLSHLEGASIAAFRTLRAELLAHGAPRELITMAERSAKDEVRHTRVTARLARRFGASPKLAKVRRGEVRSLEALAIENAAEGCVRETFGALLAAYQAEHASDAEVRTEMRSIADDETRHAALAWAVAEWAANRLDDAGRARVAEARAQAIAELRREIDAATPAALVDVAGLPTAAAARALVDGAARALWT